MTAACRRAAARDAARLGSDLALDAARALDAGEWGEAVVLLGRARVHARHAAGLDEYASSTGGGWT